MYLHGDPGLDDIIRQIHAAQKGPDDEPPEENDEEDDMTVEEMNREESRYIDRENARDINRRYGREQT